MHTQIDHTVIVPGEDPIVADCGEAREFNQRGLFIGGAIKSGTTLLKSLLDNHPQLVVFPEETHYLEERSKYLALNDYRAKLQCLLEREEVRRLAKGWSEPSSSGGAADERRYSHFDYDQFVALARDFVNQPWMNDSLLLSETIRAYGIVAGADWRNCARWVEKTPKSETCGDALDELFPDAKLIQIVRDPRAVFASLKNRAIKEFGYYNAAHKLTRRWNGSAREITRLRRDPSRFLIVRYEDLVKDPRTELETVCRFGGFEFSEKMFEPTCAGNGWLGNSAFYNEFNGISIAPAEKWKDYLTEQEIWWVELHCRKGMELAGYPLLTGGRFSISRWLRGLPGESLDGYFRDRRDSIRQAVGLLTECRFSESS